MCIVMDNWTRSEAKERRGRRLLKISRTLHTLTKMNGNQTTHFSLLGIEHNRDKPTEISITNFASGYIDVILRKGHKN